MFLSTCALSANIPFERPCKNSLRKSSTNPAGALSTSWNAFTFLEALSGSLVYAVTFAETLEVWPTILSPTWKLLLLVSSTYAWVVEYFPLTTPVAPELEPLTVSPLKNWSPCLLGFSRSTDQFL